MNNQNCPQCGTFVADELPGGLCPTCLMQAARQSQRDMAATMDNQDGFQTPSVEEMAQLFPELEVLQLVGRGGMGAVYRVRQKNLDRIVAIKIFLYRPNDPEFAARFQREARALAKLNHPNIVTVHDFGMRNEMHYLIMEFVDGVNLRQLTLEEKLTPEIALQMVPQLCDALQFAHDQGVIHRDIKPENLLMDTSGRIKIADFGLAKLTGSSYDGTLTRTQQVMGTLNYMAPEQRERPTEVDHRADIYSLGVVIYELLTGELPLGRFKPPSDKSTVDTRLDEVVMRALEKEPELRYQQANEFKTGFESAGDFFVPARAPVQPVKSYSPAAFDEPDQSRGSRFLLTLMSGNEKRGNWRPGRPQFGFTMMGGTVLDLTEVRQQEVTLILFTMMGGTEIIVPHGAEVDLDGLIIMGATVDNVVRQQQFISPEAPRMRVRIHSWGAMGGCEIRNPKPSEMPEPIREQLRSKRPVHRPTIRGGLVLLYKLMALLICICCPIMFVLSGLDVIRGDEGRMIGIISAIVGGMFWAGLDYFRVLIGAGPEEADDPKSVREYNSATWVGTFVKSLGLLLGFAVPILFVIAAFENEEDLRVAGIVCAIVCGLVFLASGFIEEFFYGKQNRRR